MIAKLFTTIIARWQLSLGILGAIVLSLTLAYCQGRSDGREAERAQYAKAEREANKVQAQSAGEAAGERETDTAATDKAQQERDNAIRDNSTAGEKPSAGRNAANCERLKRAGYSNLPAACEP